MGACDSGEEFEMSVRVNDNRPQGYNLTWFFSLINNNYYYYVFPPQGFKMFDTG